MAETKWSRLILIISSFADASIFPLPVTTFFLIIVLINPKISWNYLLLVVIGTFAGSLFGYYLGHLVWMNSYGNNGIASFVNTYIHGFSLPVFDKLNAMYEKWNVWILFGATVTPVPYGIFSVSSGIFNVNFFIFSIATLLCQTIKYSFLAFFPGIIGSKINNQRKPALKPILPD
jgi:membrane protein YqaA with SNARE-associated domain